ncbi:hypothetical protein PM082_001786 [Marasmius tenuissimus]|nr:hypothetical protein PM082_001786 [Marasmius tenuissimus]
MACESDYVIAILQSTDHGDFTDRADSLLLVLAASGRTRKGSVPISGAKAIVGRPSHGPDVDSKLPNSPL